MCSTVTIDYMPILVFAVNPVRQNISMFYVILSQTRQPCLMRQDKREKIDMTEFII